MNIKRKTLTMKCPAKYWSRHIRMLQCSCRKNITKNYHGLGVCGTHYAQLLRWEKEGREMKGMIEFNWSIKLRTVSPCFSQERTPMKLNELLPCPICNNRPIESVDRRGYISLECRSDHPDKRHAIIVHGTPENVYRIWNTRPKPSVKWPQKLSSGKFTDGKLIETDFQQGWNNAIDACIQAYEKAKKA